MVSICRITSASASLLEAYLRAAEGDEATRGFQQSRAGADWLDSENVWALVALWETQPAGAALLVTIPKADARRGFLFVDELSVLPAFRRRGVARALLAHAEEIACSLGLAGLRLLARPENDAARALYRTLGFSESPTLFCEKLM